MTAYEPEDILKDMMRRRMRQYDPRSGRHTLVSETFSGTGSPQTITLTSASTIQFIDTVVVGVTDKHKYSEYDYDLRAKTVTGTFTAGSNNITVTYYVGSTDWIYTDEPNVSLAETSYPRMRVWSLDETQERMGSESSTGPASMGGTVQFQVDIYFRNTEIGFTIDSRFMNNHEIVRFLARKVCRIIETYVDDVYPKLHDLRIISNKPWPIDKERQVFRRTIQIEAQSEVIGQ